jgi:histone acetyltransferase (RNA polymerase elongator complex component)
MARHINIPIFIPHVGCPNQCTFCNQRAISGVSKFDINATDSIIKEALYTVSPEDECEIAFFGGSFTGIGEELMISLLKIAEKYLKDGYVKSIRCSTRPDYINEHILDILKEYNVNTIELGLQSSSDVVLKLCKRGHSSLDEKQACNLIKLKGFSLVGQMMIGLPGADIESEINTAKFIIESGADAVRIYPTVVFRDTSLCDSTINGDYIPLDIEEAVRRSAAVYRLFYENNVKILRVGLCASDNLSDEDTYFAGPNHPALGELVESRIYYEKISESIDNTNTVSKGMDINIFVTQGAVSKAIGHKKMNQQKLRQKYEFRKVTVTECTDLTPFEVRIKIERGI